MASVAVELFRPTRSGSEGCMVMMADSPELQAGALVRLEGDTGGPWQVYSVHRCVKRDDGTLDHAACFGDEAEDDDQFTA